MLIQLFHKADHVLSYEDILQVDSALAQHTSYEEELLKMSTEEFRDLLRSFKQLNEDN